MVSFIALAFLYGVVGVFSFKNLNFCRGSVYALDSCCFGER